MTQLPFISAVVVFFLAVHYCPVDAAIPVDNLLIWLSLRAILGGVDLNWV
jgi:hypothetical protein